MSQKMCAAQGCIAFAGATEYCAAHEYLRQHPAEAGDDGACNPWFDDEAENARFQQLVDALGAALAKGHRDEVERTGEELSALVLASDFGWGCSRGGTLIAFEQVPDPEQLAGEEGDDEDNDEQDDIEQWTEERRAARTDRAVERIFEGDGDIDYDYYAGWSVDAFRTSGGDTVWFASLRRGYSFTDVEQWFAGAARSLDAAMETLKARGFVGWDDYCARRHLARQPAGPAEADR